MNGIDLFTALRTAQLLAASSYKKLPNGTKMVETSNGILASPLF
jgi:hypothetical protein